MTRKKKQFLSATDMDAWAAEQNEIASHNARTYLRELINYATESGRDWRAPGRLEQLRRFRDQDVYSALSRRINHGGGKRPKYDKPAIRAAVLKLHRESLESSWLIITRIAAAGVDPIDGDSPNAVLRTVRRYCGDLRWPAQRKSNIAAMLPAPTL